MNSGILFGFKDIVNSTSSSMSIFDLTSLLFKDSYLKSLSPKRYNFYVKFVSGLSNPEVLEKFFYRTKEAKLYKEELNDKIASFVNMLNKLNGNVDTQKSKKIIDNITSSIKDRFNLSDDVSSKISSMLENKNVKGGALNKGEQPMRNFIERVNKELPNLDTDKKIRTVSDLKLTEDKTKETSITQTDTVNKAKSIYDFYKDTANPVILKIKMMDRVVFIITTFIIRYISLLFINWGLSTSLINSFNYAFFYYCIIYIILFVFITAFVNIIIAYPIMDLFSNQTITNIPNLFYYFYVYTNGYMRLLVHIIFILILLFIPFIINIDNIKFINRIEKESNISYDNEKKKKVYESISIFSFIIWLLTSTVALKF